MLTMVNFVFVMIAGLKNDVLKNMLPPKKELILRVDLSSQQKQFYKALITRNYQILAKKRGGNVSFVDLTVLMQMYLYHFGFR